MSPTSTRVSSAVLAVILTVLGATSAWAVLAIRESVQEMATTTGRLNAYATLQRSVAAEVYAEAGYRRAPGPASRTRLEAAIAAVADATAQVRAVGDPTDLAVMDYIEIANERYAAEVRTSLDTPATPGDDRVAGPALDAIQTLLDGAIEGHRNEVIDARRRQVTLANALLVALPSVVLLAVVVLAGTWRAMVRQQHLLLVRSADGEHASRHDPLTGLANRRLMDESLSAELAGPTPRCSVLLVDLDGFKGVNDTLGHDAGDQVLVAVAQRLAENVRGDLVARMGGDEFAVVLRPATDPEAVAQRLLEALSEPILVSGSTLVPQAASIGIAVAPQDGTTARTLLMSADAALYRAKQAGKGRWARAEPADLLMP